jgi:death-on-curing protein
MTTYLSVEQVILIHDRQVKKHGGLEGIRDLGLLISALEMPKSTFSGKDLHRTLYDKAAAYLFHIVQNHPFFDGNKRTGAFVTLLFLKMNGAKLHLDQNQYENLVILTAKGHASKSQISQFLRKSCKK